MTHPATELAVLAIEAALDQAALARIGKLCEDVWREHGAAVMDLGRTDYATTKRLRMLGVKSAAEGFMRGQGR